MEHIATPRYGHSFTLLAGVGAGVGMLVAPLWFLTIIGLGSFFYILWYRTTSVRDALIRGALFGIVTSGAGLLALLEIFPPTTDALSFLSTGASVVFLWVVPTMALGAVTAPIAYVLFRTRRNTFAPVIAVGALVVNEELKMWAWLLITYGTGAIPEPHLSISALGYSLADAPYLLQLAQGGGLLFLTIALSVFAVTFTQVGFTLLNRRGIKSAFVLLGVSALILTIPLLQEKTISHGEETIPIAIFSSTVGMGETKNDVSLFTKLASGESPRVLIFPEGKSFQDVAEDGSRLKNTFFNQNTETLLIHSSESERAGAHYNTVTYESSTRGVLSTQDKHFLMPQGEYIPHLSSFFFSLVPNSAVRNISTKQAVVHGTSLTGVPMQGVIFGTLLCSEVFSPHLYKRLVDTRGASVLVNLADPIWFRGSHLLFNKTIQVAKVHAVQNRSYFLSAQNSAPSFIVDPQGSVISKTTWNTTDVLLFDLPVPTKN